MDAVEFLKAYNRMCGQISCGSCPLYGKGKCDVFISFPRTLDLRKCVEAVEQWAKDHPVKTRQSEFLKMFPEVKMIENEVAGIGPCALSKQSRKDCDGDCTRYRRDYWLQEVE